MQQRMAKVNHIRGFVSEYCVIAPDGIEKLRQAIPEWLEDAENHFSVLFRQLLNGLADDLSYVDNRITESNVMINTMLEQIQLQLNLLRFGALVCYAPVHY